MARIHQEERTRWIKRAFLGVTGIAWLVFTPGLRAHHEAIFGPQSVILISQKKFVSTQYYMTNTGRRPTPLSRSHIGVLGIGTSLTDRWAVSATLPFEVERDNAGESETGVQDAVVGVRYFPQLGQGQTLMTVLTLELPTGNLEHRAFGVGGGLLYGVEKGHWSVISYGLGRTELPFGTGEKRGNRIFLGGGVGYESHDLPFSPQLGLSWERTGTRREAGLLLPESRTSAVIVHPTLSKKFGQGQAFLVFSLPVVQKSGGEGWQRFRVAAGLVWQF